MWRVEIGGIKHEFYTMSLQNLISLEKDACFGNFNVMCEKREFHYNINLHITN